MKMKRHFNKNKMKNFVKKVIIGLKNIGGLTWVKNNFGLGRLKTPYKGGFLYHHKKNGLG